MLAANRSVLGIFGAGYVGLVTAACFAELGRTVVLYDVDEAKIRTLRAGGLPIHEPGLLELVERGARAGRLRFADEPREAVAGAGIVFIAVGTPMDADGRAELCHVRAAAHAIARHIDGPTVIVNKSTVPVETGDLVAAIVRAARTERHDAVVTSNPEFLREGSAVADFFHPDRIVIGCDDPQAEALLRELYAPLDAPVLVTDLHTAEMIKYTANAFLATKISFANEIAAICERVGADVKAVVAGAGADKRIGSAFLGPGLGFGGSCLPKDVNALRRIAEDAAVEPLLLDAVLGVNARQIERLTARAAYLLGGLARKRIGMLGLAFKPQTDDVRESPAIALVEALLAAGAAVRVHDPAAAENARARLGERVEYAPPGDHHAVADGADALVLATEWNEYRELDLARLRATMRRRIVLDARNLYDPAAFARAGFHYAGVGRAAHLVPVDALHASA
jgi:UDPglucose 6-dehydrogenase